MTDGDNKPHAILELNEEEFRFIRANFVANVNLGLQLISDPAIPLEQVKRLHEAREGFKALIVKLDGSKV